jgi:hypothetical protein
MKSKLILSAGFVFLASICFAQDLDTVTIVDQIDMSTQRGGNCDEGGAGTFDGDWCFETLTDGTAGLSGADVDYINVFAAEASQGAGEIESPVIDVTSAANQNPDRAWAIPAIAANSRPGATSPNYAVLVGDDGGYNALGFGEWDDEHYKVTVDVFIPDHTGSLNNAGDEFVRLGLAARVQQADQVADAGNEELTIEGAAWVIRPRGCYCLLVDSSELTVYPIKILQQPLSPDPAWDDIRDVSLTNVGSEVPPVAEFLGTGWAVTGDAWHTLSIQCKGTEITFAVDGSEETVVDFAYSAGKVAMMYRTSPTGTGDSTYDHGGKFDQIRSEPTPPPPPLAADNSWQMYE